MVAFTSLFVLSAIFASALAVPMPATGAESFAKQNGLEAIALNEKFQTFTANSPCTVGSDACAGDKFAQCPSGTLVLSDCAAGTICAALPLVNAPGTSVTCTTEADKNARIAATGAISSSPAGNAKAAAAASGSKSFTLQNGKDAQALNAEFAGLTPSSPCTNGENACVNNQFAQCANGKFVLSSCGGQLQCAALPLVNSPGTSIACTDEAQALARINATGAGDSLTGN